MHLINKVMHNKNKNMKMKVTLSIDCWRWSIHRLKMSYFNRIIILCFQFSIKMVQYINYSLFLEQDVAADLPPAFFVDILGQRKERFCLYTASMHSQKTSPHPIHNLNMATWHTYIYIIWHIILSRWDMILKYVSLILSSSRLYPSSWRWTYSPSLYLHHHLHPRHLSLHHHISHLLIVSTTLL